MTLEKSAIQSRGKLRPIHISEKGNVLFLILIAVALFAALSYAVTSSTRSGGGDASKETVAIQAAALIQYPAQVRTAVQRMMLINRLALTDLEFNKPDDFGSCTSNSVCVFHPDGGNATYIPAPQDAMAAGATDNDWWFTWAFEIENLASTDNTSSDGNDIVMLVTDISGAVCDKIHQELGITTVESINGNDIIVNGQKTGRHVDNGWAFTNYDFPLGITNFAANLAGQYQGCFTSLDGTYNFYSTIIER